MGLWYKTFAFKKIDIIEVSLNTPFNINTQTRYKNWNEPVFCLAYSNFQGKLRVARTSIYIDGMYPIYTVKTTNEQYVKNSSKAYVLILEKDMGAYHENLVTSLDYSKPFKQVYAINSIEVYTLNKSNDFTLLLPKIPKYIKFMPSFKYLNIPLGLMAYYFDIKKVNNKSYKIMPMMRWSNIWEQKTIINNGSVTLKDSSYIMTYNFITYKNNNGNSTNSQVKLSIDGVAHTHNIDVNQLFYNRTRRAKYGVISNSAGVYTNFVQNEVSNLSVEVTLGNNATQSKTIVMSQKVNPQYKPYDDCTLEVLVVYE